MLARPAQAGGAPLRPDRQQLGAIVVVAAVAAEAEVAVQAHPFQLQPRPDLDVPGAQAVGEPGRPAVRVSAAAIPACTRKSVAWAQTSVSTST